MKKTTSQLCSRLLVLIGGTALLLAMAIDVVAVIGRITGIPLLGSIELVQYMVGISGAVALVFATLNGSHALVKIITSHLSQSGAALAYRINSLVSCGFFLALFAGSAWIASDLWFGMEESELWQLPYRPLRVLICMVMLTTAGIFLYQAFKGRKP